MFVIRKEFAWASQSCGTLLTQVLNYICQRVSQHVTVCHNMTDLSTRLRKLFVYNRVDTVSLHDNLNTADTVRSIVKWVDTDSRL